MTQYVTKFVENCVTCKVAKPHSGKVQAELHPIPKVTVSWHTIHIDATGKLSGKNDSKEYIFVLIDAFTKYVLLYHTTNIDSKSSIRAVKQSVDLFGAPTRIIADQPPYFVTFGELATGDNWYQLRDLLTENTKNLSERNMQEAYQYILTFNINVFEIR